LNGKKPRSHYKRLEIESESNWIGNRIGCIYLKNRHYSDFISLQVSSLQVYLSRRHVFISSPITYYVYLGARRCGFVFAKLTK